MAAIEMTVPIMPHHDIDVVRAWPTAFETIAIEKVGNAHTTIV